MRVLRGSTRRRRAGRILHYEEVGRVGYGHPNPIVEFLGKLEIKLRRKLEQENENRI